MWYEYEYKYNHYNDYREYLLSGSKSSTSLKSWFKKIKVKPHKKRGSGTESEEEALILSTSDAGTMDIELDDETVPAKVGLEIESETRNTGPFKVLGAVDVITPRCFNDETVEDIIIEENELQHRNRIESSWSGSQMCADGSKEKSQLHVPRDEVKVGSVDLAPLNSTCTMTLTKSKLSPWSPYPRFHVQPQEQEESEVEPPLFTKWIFAQGIQLPDSDARDSCSKKLMCTKGYWHYQKCKVNTKPSAR